MPYCNAYAEVDWGHETVDKTVITTYHPETAPSLESRIAIYLGAVKGEINEIIHKATGYQDTEVLEYMLKLGADIDYINEYGDTALHIATRMLWTDGVWILLRYRADTGIKNRNNNTPINLLILKRAALDHTNYADEPKIYKMLVDHSKK